MIPPSYFLALPPAVSDDPLAFGWSLSGMMIVTLIFADWLHQAVWDMIDRPEPWRHPLTVARVGVALVSFSAVIRNGPDVLAWGLWKGTSPATRFALAHWNRLLDGASGPPMIAAWLLAAVGVPVMAFQLGKEPIPIHLYLGRSAMIRRVGVVAIATLLCFAIAFSR